MAPTLVRRLAERAAPGLVNAHRSRLIRRELAGFEPRRATHRYDGRELTLEFRDGLAEAWYDRDWDAPPELDELPKLCDGALVFDFGAHQGVVALIAAGRVGPSGRVVAVEADPHNAQMAKTNMRLNAADNVTVVQAAVAERPGTVRFHAGLNGRVQEARGGTVEVPAVTIDEMARRYGTPDVVLLDVEGHEVKALRGATGTLAGAADWSVEVHGPKARGGDSVEELLGLLNGYTLTASTGGPFAPLERPPPGRWFLVARAG